MFTKLGNATTRHPVVIIVAWIILVAVSSTAFLWGFGQGGLLKRMETSEYSIPGTDSETVQHLIDTNGDEGDTAILVVSGVDVQSQWDELAEFAATHRYIFQGFGVDSVADAFLISEQLEEAEAQAQEQLQATIKEETEKATKAALAEATAQAEEQRQQAEAQLEAQVAQAAALGPEAQAQAEAQANAAREEMEATFQAQMAEAEEQVRAQVTEQVTAEVTRQFEEAQKAPDVVEAKQDAEDQKQALLSDKDAGYVVIVSMMPNLDQEVTKRARTDLDEATQKYQAALDDQFPGATIQEMSQDKIESAIISQVERDMITGEALSLPVAALIMLIVFGGALAAGMPLVGAISAIAAGMGTLWLSTFVTTIDSFILNIVSIIGVALSIDYGLLVVSRYREESKQLMEDLPQTRSAQNHAALKRSVVQPAVVATLETAGRTVTFSAVTIAASISGLLLVRIHLLQTIAWGGIIVTLLAVLAAITLVPALLTVVGTKLLVPSPITKVPGIGRLVNAVGDTSTDHGVFYSIARWVQKRPWIVMITTAAVLVVMALPAQNLSLRNYFADYIPQGTALREAYDTIQDDYPDLATPSVSALVDAPEESGPVLDFVAEVSALGNVERVVTEPLPQDSELTIVSVQVEAADQAGPEVTQVVDDMRDLDPGATVWVGGAAAIQKDFTHALVEDVPWAIAVVVIAVMILLFLMTASLVVPVRALIINAMSLMAAVGVTTEIFTHGWFGVPRTPGLETFVVAVLIAFGFGLAMDYEVFLLARIKEYWDAGDDNNTAVAKGLQRSGRIITSAAAIIVAVFIGFAMGDMVAIKQIGVALAVMVTVDATVVRLFLVPAAMTILGKWNWWAPKPLQKLAQKVGMEE